MNVRSFEQLTEMVRAVMQGFKAPWAIAGGWAIDLYIGRVTRPHEDVDIAVFRDDQPELQSLLSAWTLEKISDGKRYRWRPGERLSLPVHEVHARPNADSSLHLEFLLNERAEAIWRYRRNASVTRAFGDAIVQSSVGLPVLAPEIVLLYKSKSRNAQHDADFGNAISIMTVPQLHWLLTSMRQYYAEHPWMLKLFDRLNHA